MCMYFASMQVAICLILLFVFLYFCTFTLLSPSVQKATKIMDFLEICWPFGVYLDTETVIYAGNRADIVAYSTIVDKEILLLQRAWVRYIFTAAIQSRYTYICCSDHCNY